MRDLLYLPGINPPNEVLHHAILYWDRVVTLVPDDGDGYLSDDLKRAADAGVYEPLVAARLWQEREVLSDAWTTLWRSIVNRQERLRPLLARSVERLKAEVEANRDAFNAAADAAVLNQRPVGERGFSQSQREAQSVEIDFALWDNVISEVFGPVWSARCEEPNEPEDWASGFAMMPDFQARLLAGTAYSLAGRARRDATQPLIVPNYSWRIREIIDDCAVESSGDHLLVRVDVGQFLPEPPPGVDTAVVIDFRRRYDDERRRLISAVEALVKEAAKAHSAGEPADIARDVREELEKALADLQKAGGRRIGGWVKRAALFTVAAGAGGALGAAAAPFVGVAGAGITAAATAIGAAGGSVTANWASNMLPPRRNDSDFNYLYRVNSELDDLALRTPAGAEAAG